MFNSIAHIVGYISAILSTLTFVPLIWKIIKEKNLNDVSFSTYKIYLISCILWALWAIFSWSSNPDDWLKNLTIIIPNILCGSASSVVLYLKWKSPSYLIEKKLKNSKRK